MVLYRVTVGLCVKRRVYRGNYGHKRGNPVKFQMLFGEGWDDKALLVLSETMFEKLRIFEVLFSNLCLVKIVFSSGVGHLCGQGVGGSGRGGAAAADTSTTTDVNGAGGDQNTVQVGFLVFRGGVNLASIFGNLPDGSILDWCDSEDGPG